MELVTVFTSVSINEVNYVKAMLETQGIQAFVYDEAIGQLAPHHLFGQGGPRIVVLESDVPDAKKLIEDYERCKQSPGDHPEEYNDC